MMVMCELRRADRTGEGGCRHDCWGDLTRQIQAK